MSKLTPPPLAGFNAGKNYFSKMVSIDDIIVDPEISKIFTVNEKMVELIYQKILDFGYDDSQPVVLLKGTMIILDGHTRLAAAKKAGLKEIPVAYREFEDRESAMMYTLERQALRRNLIGNEILMIAHILLNQGRKKHDGTGRAAEQLAKRFNVSVSTLYQALAVERDASEEVKQKVRNGEMSLKKAHSTTITSNSDIEPKITNIQGLSDPDLAKFLKAAVILLIESDQPFAAHLLINKFIRTKDRSIFFKSLPDSVRTALESEAEQNSGFATPE